MRVILNIIWLVFSGIWMFLLYMFAAVLCCLLIITIPLGVAAVRIGLYALWPFGRTVVKRPDAGDGSTVLNVIWIVLCGWWLALSHLLFGVLMCISIIGIPLGLGAFKLIPISLRPFGTEVVDIDQARAMGHQGLLEF